MVRSGLAIVIVLLAIVYLFAARSSTNGALAPPLDDTVIYLQYAKAIASGHPFSYTPGAPPTAGATSWLYPFLLAPGFLLGLHGDSMLYYAFFLNVAFLFIVALLVYQLTLPLTDQHLAALAAFLVVLTGPILWGFLSMMEIGLLSVALVLVAFCFTKEWDSFPPWRTLLSSALLPFCRPEGILLAIFVVTFIALRLRRWRTSKGYEATPFAASIKTWPRPWLKTLVLLLPLLASVLWLVLNRTITGSFFTTTFVSKSILFAPQVLWFEKLGSISSNAATILQDPFGLNPTYLPILLFPLIVLGLARQIGGEIQHRMPGLGVLVLGTFLIVVASGSQAAVALSQHFRYVIALFPLAMVLAMIGLQEVSRFAKDGFRLSFGIGALVLTLMFVATPRWVQVYAEDVRDIHNQQVFVGRWVSRNLPPGSIVALNDAGAIAYYGERPVYDLLGLVTKGASIPFRHGTGAVLERILELPPAERPTHFVIFPDWFAFPEGGLLTEMFRTQLNRISITGGYTVVVYRADYAETEKKAEPAQDHSEGGAWVLVDSLNVADLKSEKSHHYRQADQVARGFKDLTVLREFDYASGPGHRVLDGGRIILGSEQFRVRTKKGEELKLAMRTDASFSLVLKVYANGQFVGLWSYPMQGSAWVEPSFVVPGAFITEGHTQLRIELDDATGLSDYAPFQYWFYQRPG